MNEQELKIAEKIKELLCDSLGIEADVLTNDIPLFGDGIGLDSIDSLEMIAAIDKEYGGMFDFLRYAYGYTATSAQHIAKFAADYHATSRYTYRP